MHKVRDRYDYPYNLIAAISQMDGALPEDRPDDIEVSLQYVLLKVTSRQSGVTMMYFRDKKSLEEIGREYGITRERVRQIIAKTLRTLRSPGNLVYIKNGITGVMKLNADEERKKGYAEGYAQAQKDAAPSAVEHENKGNRNQSIFDMDLSVRAFNCLYRANLRTSDEIARCDFYDLIKIRNLGRRTLNEIIKVMGRMGYETSHMMEPEVI